MHIRRTLIALVAVAAAALMAPGARADGFKIIVHPDNPVESLSREDLSAIFLKTRLELEDGRKLVPVDQSASSDVRGTFTRMIHRRAMDAVMAYWQQQIFAGRGVPPPVKDGDAAVLEFVRSNPDAIGYIDTLAPADGVSIVRVVVE